jgi:hypothetical protein
MGPTPDALLKRDALTGIRIAISASESPDLLRLGLVETHFRLALAEIARSVLISGGKLSYGGHLDPEGYTAMLMRELQRYSRRDKPLRIYLAWHEHRRLSKAEFDRSVEDLGLFGEIVCLDADGNVVRWGEARGDQPEPVSDKSIQGKALSALRAHMAKNETGRVIIGGKRAGFAGKMPGVLEEAIASTSSHQPLYVAGGFGGIAADIAVAMGRLSADWLPATSEPLASDVRANLDGLRSTADAIGGWPHNGLSDKENARLAATYRPSEIAALVSLGLGRLFGPAA